MPREGLQSGTGQRQGRGIRLTLRVPTPPQVPSTPLQQLGSLVQHLQRLAGLVNVRRQQLPEAPRPREALAQPEDMPGDVMHRAAALHVRDDVRTQLFHRLGPADHRRRAAEQLLVDLGQQVRVVVRLAPEHHAVEGLQVGAALVEGLDAAVEHQFQVREVGLQLRRHVIAQRWDLTVLLGRQAFEDGDARMHGEAAAPGVAHLADEIAQLGVAVAAVDADAVLDRDRDADRVLHGLDAIGHQTRMAHQAGADHVVLHPVAGAADVEVDLVVASLFGQAGAGGQVRRHAAAQLQGQRVLGLVMAQETLGVVVQQGAGGDHFGVEQGVLGEQAQEEPTVSVCPVHHRRHREAAGWLGARGLWL